MSVDPDPLDEAALRDLMTRCGDPVLILGFDGDVRWANPTLQSILGVPMPALRGQAFEECTRVEDRPRLQEALRSARRGVQAARIVFRSRVRGAGETWRNIEWVTTVSEPMQCFYLQGREIAPHEPGGGEDREQASLFRQITDNMREVLWVVAPDKSEQVFVSRSYEEVWGRSCESLYEDPHSSLRAVHPDDAACLHRAIEMQSRGEPVSSEYRILRPDGTVRWIRARSVPVLDSKGRLYRTVGVSEDITSQRLVQAELRRQQDLLQEITRRTADGVFIKDLDGRYVLMNDSGATFVSRSIDETLGRDDWALFDAESAARVVRNDKHVLQSDAAQTFEEALTAAGRTRDYTTTKSPFRDAEGRTVGVLGVCRDQSHRRESDAVRRALDAEMARRRRVIDAQDMQRATLSRELNEDLGQILAGLQLHLLSKHGRIVDLHEEIQLVRRVASGLGDLSLCLHPLHLEECGLFTAVVERFGKGHEKAGARVRFGHTGDEPPLTLRWKEHVFHIVEEGIVRAETFGRAQEIFVGFEWQEGSVCITVRDDGKALFEDQDASTPLHNLFDRATALGGTATWRQDVTRGVRIEVRVPTPTGLEGEGAPEFRRPLEPNP